MKVYGLNWIIIATVSLPVWVGCQTQRPTGDAPALQTDVARLERLLGISGRRFSFTLGKGQRLVVTFQAMTGSIPEQGYPLVHVVDFETNQKFSSGGKVDIEIMQPSQARDSDLIRILVKLPGFDKYFHYSGDFQSMQRQFADGDALWRNSRVRLLEFSVEERTKIERKLSIDAEIQRE